MRKLYITDKGKGWAGVAINDPVLLELSTKIIEELKWKGGIELEFMQEKSGEYSLLEINPRFPAWVYLATAAGLNLPGMAVELALGKEVPTQTNYTAGTVFVRASWDLITDMQRLEKLTTAGEV
jgi:carbamoyl-phosphate synthase large subunit